jgi:hypothetical protein
MTGSKKAWATYLGLEEKEARSTWSELKLLSPAEYVRASKLQDLLALVALKGSVNRAADHLGVSETMLRLELNERLEGSAKKTLPTWSIEACIEIFEKYRSVSLVARITGYSETVIRKKVDDLGLELSTLLDFSFGNNSNAKGRRAELEWARIRGDKVLLDKNVAEGSQASYDFDDRELGRVNVKSSRRYRYRAQSRASDPHFFKFSTKGRENCDHLALMAYDEKMTTLVGMVILPTAKLKAGTLLLTGKELAKDGVPLSPVG